MGKIVWSRINPRIAGTKEKPGFAARSMLLRIIFFEALQSRSALSCPLAGRMLLLMPAALFSIGLGFPFIKL